MLGGSRHRAVWLLSVAMAGCLDPAGPERSDLDVLFTDLHVAERIVSRATDVTDGTFSPLFGRSLEGCSLEADSQTFRCATVTSGSTTYERSFQLLGSSGEPRSTFARDSTDGLRAIATLNDSTLSSGTQLMVRRLQHSDHTLGSLISGERTLAGTILNRLVISGPTRNDTLATTIATDLALPPRGSSSYPTGTITITSTIPGIPSPNVSTVTFDGTSVVRLVEDRPGTRSTCSANLDTLSKSCVLTPIP